MEHKPPVASGTLDRRSLIAGAASLAFASTVNVARGATLKSIVIAEPVHSIGYVPLYLAIDQGLFAKRGLDVKTMTASGGAHVTALVSGQVWGNIGGPESCAMANVGKSDPLISMCNVVNRSMNWMMAKKGLAPKSSSNADLAALMKGRKMAFNRYGGTPDVCGRWLLKKVGLDAKTDVTIINQADSAAGPFMIKSGAVDIVVASEPQITYGKQMGIWDDPFFSFPSLGEYSYSVISVRKSTMTNDPQTTQAFTDAMLEALKITATNRSAVEAVTRKEFPTLSDAGVKGSLDRFYDDHIWSRDGLISARGFALDMDVVYSTGEFNTPVAFSSVIDMEFVIKSKVGKA
jgi:NitT/TauT family transport system substrate-binding protein